MRFAIVEKIHIIIYQINTEMPFVLMRINGTVEMLSPHKTTILRTGKYPTKIIITHIQKIIVTFQRIIMLVIAEGIIVLILIMSVIIRPIIVTITDMMCTMDIIVSAMTE